MTDVPYAIHADAAQAVPVRRLTELTALLIIALMTVQYPLINKFTALGWLGLFAGLMLLRRTELGYVLIRWWPLLLLPLMATASFAWSDIPSISGRYGVQLIVTILVGLLLARTLAPSRLLTVFFLAMLAVCVLSIAVGRQGASPTGPVLIGLLGSKNTMGAVACLLVICSVGVLLERRVPPLLRLLALPGLAIGGYIVAVTQSATAQIMAVVTPTLLIGLCSMHRLMPAARLGVIIALVLLLAPLIALAPEISRAIEDFTINVLHKDPGLTGRDYLWAHAISLIEQRPLLGYGFEVTWLSESADTIGLLRWAKQADGHGFNFHNTYLEVAVDLGLIGGAVFAVTIAAAVVAGARQYIMAPTAATTFFFALLLQTTAQTMTEVLITPFSAQTALLFIYVMYAFWRPRHGWREHDDPALYAPASYAAQPAWTGYAPVGWAMIEGPGGSATHPARDFPRRG